MAIIGKPVIRRGPSGKPTPGRQGVVTAPARNKTIAELYAEGGKRGLTHIDIKKSFFIRRRSDEAAAARLLQRGCPPDKISKVLKVDA